MIKGGMLMNRFKLMTMTMNRFRLLLCTSLVVAVAALSLGSGVIYAQQEPTAAVPAVAPNPAAVKLKAAAAAKARANRDAAINKRRAAKQYIQKVVEGQDSAPAAPASSGGAQ
jgi:hypothetical protein